MQITGLNYSIPYFILVVYFVTLVIAEYITSQQEHYQKSNRQIIQLGSLAGMLFFFGFRGFVGWDWYLYYPLYNGVPDILNLSAEIFSRYPDTEPGFIIYTSISKSIWSNYNFFTFLNTLIDLAILNIAINRFAKYNYAFSFLLFIVLGGFYLETDLLRAAKSIMIFLLALKYISERKIIKYFLLILLAISFHKSAILYMPLYFFFHRRIPRLIVVVIFVTGLILFFLQVEYVRPFLLWISSMLGEEYVVLLNKYLHIDVYSTSYGFTIGLVERLLTALLVLIYYYKLMDDDNRNTIFLNSYIIYFIIFFYFAEIKIIPIRVGGLFSFTYWFLIPALLRVIKRNNNKLILISGFILYSLVKVPWMTDTILYKYVNVIFGPDNHSERLKIFESVADILMK